VRVLFVFPYDTTYRHVGGGFSASAVYANLTFSTLAAGTPDGMDVDYTYIDEGVEDPGDRYREDWDVVGISLTASNSRRAYRVARHFRERGIPVVLGGAHATFMPDEVAPHADVVVRGAGDLIWGDLLREFASAGALVPGVRDGGRIRQPEGRFPDRDIIAGKAYMKYPTMMTSRGCRNGCSFCTTSAMWRDSGPRDIDDVMAEVRMLTAAQGEVIFLDSNLIMDRAFALELLRRLEPLKLRWGGLVTSHFMFDEELLAAAERSGCLGVLIGFESVNQMSLDGCRKGFNTAERYVEGVANLHRHRIGALATMVVGFDCDDLGTFDRTLEFVREARLDTIHYTVLTPFPGTPLYDELDREGRILTTDWSRYDTIHAVFQPKLMSPEDLEEGYRRVWLETYSLGGIAARLRGASFNRAFRVGANLSLGRHARDLVRCYANRDDLVLGGVR